MKILAWFWMLTPLWQFVYWRYKNFIGNPALLAAIENSKRKTNGLLATVAEIEVIASIKPHVGVVERFGWICFAASCIMMFGFRLHSFPVILLGVIGMLSIFQSYAMDWVFNPLKQLKAYFVSPYALGALVPLFLVSSPIPNTPSELSWVFAPPSAKIAILGAMCALLTPYIVLSLIFYTLVGLEILIIFTILRSLKLVHWIQPDFVDFIMAFWGLLWAVAALH